jgi:hypothetical protein
MLLQIKNILAESSIIEKSEKSLEGYRQKRADCMDIFSTSGLVLKMDIPPKW